MRSPAAAPAAAPAGDAAATATEAATADSTAADAATAEAAAPSGETFRIALIMPSTTTDYSWSQSIYDGLKKVQEEMGGEGALEIAVTENMFQVADAANAIRDYATDGYDLVIAHGAQYGTPLFEVAKDFPDTSFAWGTTTDTGADKGLNNVFAYEPAAQEGGYLNGVAAALLSEKGVIGVIGPVEAGDAKLYINGFVDGVKATKPDAVGQCHLHRCVRRHGPGGRSGQHADQGGGRRADRLGAAGCRLDPGGQGQQRLLVWQPERPVGAGARGRGDEPGL